MTAGNLPVDSAIILEFLPASHAYLLTVLSLFWALAQLFATLVAWPLLGTMTCEAEDPDCTRGENMGWRYFVIVMGGVALLMFLIRFVAFTIFESPKYHMGKGRDDEAVRIVHEVARRNGRTSNLTIDDLRVCEGLGNGQSFETDNKAAIKRKLAAVNGKHVKALFATKKLAFSTALIMFVWAFIGLAFPLYVRLDIHRYNDQNESARANTLHRTLSSPPSFKGEVLQTATDPHTGLIVMRASSLY
jgi:MFS family permease